MNNRHIDYLIGKHLFSLHIDRMEAMPNGRLVPSLDYHHFHYSAHNTTSYTLPFYSTDISAAWLVLERMQQKPQTLEEAYDNTRMRFAMLMDDVALWRYSAQIAAGVICKKALQAMGVAYEL